MAKKGAGAWALPVAIVAGIYLIREAKETGAAVITATADVGSDLLDSAASSGEYYGQAYYEAERQRQLAAMIAENIAASERIEAAVLSGESLGPGQRSGCVTGTLGAYCGKWQVSQAEASSDTPQDSCHVIGTSGRGGFTKYFVGTYCRDARSQGLIGPRGTISGYTQMNMRLQGWLDPVAIDPGLR